MGRLRLAGAAIVFAMGIVLVSEGAGGIGWTIVVMAWLVGLGWTAAFFRARSRARSADAHFLEVGPSAMRMARGRDPVEVTWAEVSCVRVDEERLVIWVDRHQGEPVRVEPVWRGVGLHELAETLRDAAKTP
ncbi:MAG: hypothetical protein AAGE52_04910 [Myxococcota bacterium]